MNTNRTAKVNQINLSRSEAVSLRQMLTVAIANATAQGRQSAVEAISSRLAQLDERYAR